MILGITEDFSTNVTLDTSLTGIPASGLYLNSGVHPSITLENLLAFLPFPDVSFTAWSDSVVYEKYTVNKRRSNIVSYEGKIYESIKAENENKQPDTEPTYWLETNMESLKLKNFIDKVVDKVYSELNLTKRLINNQFIYEVGNSEVMLPGDFAAWVFEPKGSDYTSIKLNQISIQKSGTTPISLYVLNQPRHFQNAVLVDTLQITPSNGIVDFKDLNYTFKGVGKWIFAIDSTETFIGNGLVDPLVYDGFVCYTANGNGEDVDSAKWSYSTKGNGLGFNVSAYLDSSVYVENNLEGLANFVRATFELMTLQMFLHNSSNRGNRPQQIQLDKDMLIAETKSLDMNTVASRFRSEKQKALRVMEKTFDTQLKSANDDDFQIEMTSI